MIFEPPDGVHSPSRLSIIGRNLCWAAHFPLLQYFESQSIDTVS
jgi:hypothetical protein